jgi:hypothetical protein
MKNQNNDQVQDLKTARTSEAFMSVFNYHSPKMVVRTLLDAIFLTAQNREDCKPEIHILTDITSATVDVMEMDIVLKQQRINSDSGVVE